MFKVKKTLPLAIVALFALNSAQALEGTVKLVWEGPQFFNITPGIPENSVLKANYLHNRETVKALPQFNPTDGYLSAISDSSQQDPSLPQGACVFGPYRFLDHTVKSTCQVSFNLKSMPVSGTKYVVHYAPISSGVQAQNALTITPFVKPDVRILFAPDLKATTGMNLIATGSSAGSQILRVVLVAANSIPYAADHLLFTSSSSNVQLVNNTCKLVANSFQNGNGQNYYGCTVQVFAKDYFPNQASTIKVSLMKSNNLPEDGVSSITANVALGELVVSNFYTAGNTAEGDLFTHNRIFASNGVFEHCSCSTNDPAFIKVAPNNRLYVGLNNGDIVKFDLTQATPSAQTFYSNSGNKEAILGLAVYSYDGSSLRIFAADINHLFELQDNSPYSSTAVNPINSWDIKNTTALVADPIRHNLFQSNDQNYINYLVYDSKGLFGGWSHSQRINLTSVGASATEVVDQLSVDSNNYAAAISVDPSNKGIYKIYAQDSNGTWKNYGPTADQPVLATDQSGLTMITAGNSFWLWNMKSGYLGFGSGAYAPSCNDSSLLNQVVTAIVAGPDNNSYDYSFYFGFSNGEVTLAQGNVSNQHLTRCEVLRGFDPAAVNANARVAGLDIYAPALAS